MKKKLWKNNKYSSFVDPQKNMWHCVVVKWTEMETLRTPLSNKKSFRCVGLRIVQIFNFKLLLTTFANFSANLVKMSLFENVGLKNVGLLSQGQFFYSSKNLQKCLFNLIFIQISFFQIWSNFSGWSFSWTFRIIL